MNLSPQNFTFSVNAQLHYCVRASGVCLNTESLLASYSQLTNSTRKKTCSKIRRMYDEATIVIRSQENDIYPASVHEL